MSDELVKRLRANTSWGDDRFAEAAARIEALTAERETLEQDNHRWKMECENFWRDREKALTAERDRLREAIMFWLEAEEPDVDAAINMMRAALKGETP